MLFVSLREGKSVKNCPCVGGKSHLLKEDVHLIHTVMVDVLLPSYGGNMIIPASTA